MMFAFDINSPENQEKIEYYRNILSENDFNNLISSMSSENLKAEKAEYNKKIQVTKNKQKQARRNNQNFNSSSNRDQFVEFQLHLYASGGGSWGGSSSLSLYNDDLNIQMDIEWGGDDVVDWNTTNANIQIYTDNSDFDLINCTGNDLHQVCTIFLPVAMTNTSDYVNVALESSFDDNSIWSGNGNNRSFILSYQDQNLFGAAGSDGFPDIAFEQFPYLYYTNYYEYSWVGSEYEHLTIVNADFWFIPEICPNGYFNGAYFRGENMLWFTPLYHELFNDCAGIQNGPNQVDECGVCDDDPTNDNSTCLDECGIPNGDNSSCADCQGTPNGDAWVSDCGCVAADNSGDDCDDQCGVPNGDNSTCTDECGVINGNSNPLDCNNDGVDDVCEETYDTGFYDGAQSGDINQDGMTNVVDIILYVNVVLGN